VTGRKLKCNYIFKNVVYRYRTVAIDMRGYGNSEKPPGVENYAMDLLVNDVKQVVEALGSY
jgi:pimeloyl-ACP methyl ester carboxylesterase